ncbi:MAG: tetratricopeptide repeat protein, partial [Myxococcaceae bacterium]
PGAAPGSADAELGALQAKLSGQLSAAEREAVSYELARLLAGRGRAAEAVALFDALSRGEGARAEAALYEAGRLRLRNLGDPAGALEAFSRYRGRFGGGALVQEVALSTIEAHLARSEQDAALRELDTFMVDYPESERRDDLRFIRGNLRRERGECQAAAGDYLLLLDDPKRGEDALFFAAGCERKNGDLEGARRHLRAYLERYPAGVHRAEAERALGGE